MTLLFGPTERSGSRTRRTGFRLMGPVVSSIGTTSFDSTLEMEPSFRSPTTSRDRTGFASRPMRSVYTSRIPQVGHMSGSLTLMLTVAFTAVKSSA